MVEYVDPRTGLPFPAYTAGDGNVPFPTVDGIPVLTREPRLVLARIPKNANFPDVRRAGLPDAVTPHLTPGLLGAPDGLGEWLKGLGDLSPESVAYAFAVRHAPNGPILDVGCGVGVMTRRMASLGRPIWAFDENPDAVALARGLLSGGMPQVSIPTHRGGMRRVKVPFRPLAVPVQFCIAEPVAPPFAENSFAWIHVGALDEVGDSVADVLVACADLLVPGGILTVCTSHGYGHGVEENATPPEGEFLEAIEAVGLRLLDQRDRVPGVRRDFDRSFSVRFFHCVVARKGT